MWVDPVTLIGAGFAIVIGTITNIISINIINIFVPGNKSLMATTLLLLLLLLLLSDFDSVRLCRFSTDCTEISHTYW